MLHPGFGPAGNDGGPHHRRSRRHRPRTRVSARPGGGRRRHLLGGKRELLEALTGKEEAFDLPAGDAAGLEDVLGEYFPAPELDGRMRAAIDEAVRPLREQIDTLIRSLAPRVTVGEDVAKKVAGTALPPGFTAALQEKIAAGMWGNVPVLPVAGTTVPPGRVTSTGATGKTPPTNPRR